MRDSCYLNEVSEIPLEKASDLTSHASRAMTEGHIIGHLVVIRRNGKDAKSKFPLMEGIGELVIGR